MKVCKTKQMLRSRKSRMIWHVSIVILFAGLVLLIAAGDHDTPRIIGAVLGVLGFALNIFSGIFDTIMPSNITGIRPREKGERSVEALRKVYGEESVPEIREPLEQQVRETPDVSGEEQESEAEMMP